MTIWIAGHYEGHGLWTPLLVTLDETRAREACVLESDFVAPIEVETERVDPEWRLEWLREAPTEDGQ